MIIIIITLFYLTIFFYNMDILYRENNLYELPLHTCLLGKYIIHLFIFNLLFFVGMKKFIACKCENIIAVV